jgi:VIT1/CCC1 family predicted Fe2+/Mn2+ transporter
MNASRMANSVPNSSRQLLDPIERSSEVLFGLIMVLTFTGSLRVTGADHDDVNRMLLAALGCNLAWGIIDAVMYLLATLSQRGHNLQLVRNVQAANAVQGRQLLTDALSSELAEVLTTTEVEAVRQRLTQLPWPTDHPRLHRSDYLAAIGVFLLVFLSTFPVVLPFLFLTRAGLALRISNAAAIVMLFLTGWAYGKHAGYRPWRVGLWMVLLGLALVALTIALGG